MKKNLEYYLKLNYPVEINKIPEEDGGGYSACIPVLGRHAFIADGYTLEEAVRNVLNLKDHYIKELYKKGIPIPEPETTYDFDEASGKFLVRIPKELHRLLIKRAEENGVSLNQYVLFLLTRAFEQDKIEHKMQSFVGKFENLFYDFMETEYNLNLKFDNTIKLLADVQKENTAKLIYYKAG